MARCWFAAAALLGASATLALAQAPASEREIKAQSGRDTRVGIYTNIRPDCTAGPLPAIRLAEPPAHGTVRVKRGTFKGTNVKQCLALEVPAFLALYHAPADFSGTDEFALEVTLPSGQKHTQRIRVLVSRAPAQGI